MSRPAKPTRLKILNGDRKDRINTNEPKPGGPVRPPTWLDKQAKQVWRLKAPDLIDKKVLTTWDIEAFGLYCDAVVRHRESCAKLNEQGAVIETPVCNGHGEIVGTRHARNPWQAIWKETSEVMLRYGARFGMTPSDRASITVSTPEAPKGGGRLLS